MKNGDIVYFKKELKVTYVTGTYFLTPGKPYAIKEISGHYYIIDLADGDQHYLHSGIKELLITKGEHRNNKLKELLN